MIIYTRTLLGSSLVLQVRHAKIVYQAARILNGFFSTVAQGVRSFNSTAILKSPLLRHPSSLLTQ
jgi:hypothetical protein